MTHLTLLDDLLYARSIKSPWFPVSSTRPKCWTCSVDVSLQTSPGIAVNMTLLILFSNKCEQQTLTPLEYTDTFSNYPVWTHTYTNTHEQQLYCVGTLSQMTERSAERCIRQETGWLAGWLADSCSVSQQLGALQTHTTDTFLFISHTTNVLLFKFHCNIFIGVGVIKEMPGSVASGTHCTLLWWMIVLAAIPWTGWFFYVLLLRAPYISQIM